MKKICFYPRLIRRLLIIISCVCFASGCSATAGNTADNQARSKPAVQKQRAVQIIVKFRDNVSDPSHAEFVDELSSAVGAKMSYFRPMSGGAHVFRVETGLNHVNVKDILEKLSRRQDVLYAEPDEMMRHH